MDKSAEAKEMFILMGAIKKWGDECQMIKAMEEAGELVRAIGRVLLDLKNGQEVSREAMDNLAEEVADVEIMLAQIGIIFNLYPTVYRVRCEKLTRLEAKIKE